MPFAIARPELVEEKEFGWFPLRRQDLQALHDLLQIVNRVDDTTHWETAADLERQFEDPWSDPEKDARVIYTRGGILAAFARVFVNPTPEDEAVAHLWHEIEPEARGRGLEEALFEWMEERARQKLAELPWNELPRALPRRIRIGFPAHLRDRIAFYQERGYRVVRKFFHMQRDLNEPIPAQPLPEGLTLRTYSPDLDEPLRQAMEESFRDHWGHSPITPEEWQQFFVQADAFRPDLTLVVMDGDQVAAFCLNQERVEENERLGIRQGWIGTLGTRRPWRRRGIGSALLCESMRRFKAVGFEYAGLGVDTENLTGALGIYERLGFKPIRTFEVLQKEIAE